MHILIVDDDKVIRFLLYEALETNPAYHLSEASNGDEAWERLQQEPLPDLCILDVNMGAVSGLDLLRKMRAEPRLENIPVIMCTTEDERPIVMQAVGLAAKSYIVKPFTPEMVCELVKKALPSGPVG